MRLILLVVSLLFSQRIVAQQFTLRYQQCTNCPIATSSMTVPVGGFTYSAIQNLVPQHIASDFGRRGSNSLYHLGVDVSSQGGDNDVGDRIYSLETGTVITVKGSGTYKVLVIRGTQRFGYGHIFFNQTVDATLGSRCGDFILKRMNSPHTTFYAIIYAPQGGAVTAIGEVAGTVTHPNLNNNQPITVSTQITNTNTPVAPVGNSGNANGAAHIHLYNFQNDPVANDFNSSYLDANGYSATFFRNPKNPLEFVVHNNPTYTITFPNNINLTYPGDTKSSMRVRAAMNGATGGSYSNAIMDIEDVELFIKAASKPAPEFRLIKGTKHESKIIYGGRLNANRYPSTNYPANNTGTNAVDIAKGVSSGGVDEGIGNASRTGVVPLAYSSQPYDEFYFSDFFTRIHENDNFGGASALFASVNEDARYPDGRYEAYVRLTTITSQQHSSQTQTFTIDNFRPYVKEVIIRKNNESGRLIYRGYYQWNGSALSKVSQKFDDAGPTDNIWIKIIVSESAQNISVNIPSANGTNYNATTVVPNSNDTEFIFTHNPITASASHTLNIQGQDISGNPLQSDPTLIPVRQANGTWGAGVSPGTDSNHGFNTGTATCSNANSGGRVAANRRESSDGCLFADFSSDMSNPSVNIPVLFEPFVSGNGLLTYKWNFGSGAIPATSTSSGPQTVVYSTNGAKTISLEICDNTGACITKTKTDLINVGAPSTQLTVDFSADRYGGMTNDNIQLTAMITGAAGEVSYSWSFGEGLSSGQFSDQNPLIAYNTPGNKTIQLTVSDANGSVTKVKNNYLLINSLAFNISVTISGCGYADGTGRISLSNFVNGGNGPPYDSYLWDFGDGTFTSTSSSTTVSHYYKKSGKYTVRLTVCDETSCGTAESVNCVDVPVVVDNNSLDADFLIGDLPALAPPFQVSLNSPVNFSNATAGGGNPNTFTYSWDFESHYKNGTVTESAVPATNRVAGPVAQEVYYITTGRKEVTLVVDNGFSTNRETKVDALEVVAGLGSGTCYATIGEVSISTTCWNQTSLPRFTVPISKSNCPVAKTEVIYWISPGQGVVLPNGILDFNAIGVTPHFPVSADFSFSAYQYDGINYNRIGYKRQRFTIYGPVVADAGPDKQVCLGSQEPLGLVYDENRIYQWSSTSAPVNLLNNLMVSNPVFSAVQKGTFRYILTETDKNSGCSRSDEVAITVDRPEVSNNEVYAGLAVSTPLNTTTAGGFGGNIYLWSPTDRLTSANSPAPTFMSETEGDFYYTVTVTDQKGCNGSGQIFVSASSKPGNLRAVAASFNRISLTWIDRSSNETSFVIQRSENNGAFVNYALANADAQYFEDLQVVRGVNYSYRVSANIPGAGTAYSNESSANTDMLPQFSLIPGNVDAYGDYDNDGDLDYVNVIGGDVGEAHIYINSNDIYVLNQTIAVHKNSSQVFSGAYSIFQGDFDNDNDLDIYLIPYSNIALSTLILVNDQSNFTVLSTGLIVATDPRFGILDHDHDNDLDLIYTDLSSTPYYSRLSQNQGANTFTHVNTNIPIGYTTTTGVLGNYIGAADVNNDGYADLMIHDGVNLYNYPYRNGGYDFFTRNQVCVNCGFGDASIDLADFDGDNKNDIIQLGGAQSSIFHYSTSILKNDATWSEVMSGLPDLLGGNCEWADYDSDGDQDFFISGYRNFNSDYRNAGGQSHHIYQNNNGTFNLAYSFPKYLKQWIDYDSDGDLDILTTEGGVYRNNNGLNRSAFNQPSPPADLCVYFNGNSATFTWTPSTNNEVASAGFTYNLFVKQNGAFIMSPLADINTGYRFIQKKGNVGSNTSWTLTLPENGTIEWGVQGIDNKFLGSSFQRSSYDPHVTICDDITASGLFQAREILVPQNCSSSAVTVSGGATLTLKAANSIKLLPGFKVAEGSFLKGILTDFSESNSPCVTTGSGGRMAFSDPEEDEKKRIEEKNTVKVFPNPTRGTINISADFEKSVDLVHVEIINLAGVIIHSKKYYDITALNETIDIRESSSGVYLVRIKTDSSTTNQRVLKL